MRYPVAYGFHGHHSVDAPLLVYFMRLCLHRVPSLALFLKVYSGLTVHVSDRFVFEFEVSE